MTYNFGWEHEPKLKETTANYFVSRYHWSIGVYACEHSVSVKQYTRIVRASLTGISSLEVVRYD